MANKILPCIYRILNTVNGKVYIGSAMRPTKRWREHYTLLNQGLHHSRHLQGAWRTYGPAAFIFEIIEKVAATDLIAAEQRHLDAVRPYDPEVGYNTSPTAWSTMGVPCSPETAAKIGAANRGRKHTDEHKAAIAPWGRSPTDDTRQKLREAMTSIGHKPSEEAWRKGVETRRGKPLSAGHRERQSISLKANNDHLDHCRQLALSQRKLTQEQITEAVALKESGMSYKNIGKQFGVSMPTMRRWILREIGV